MKHIQVLKVVVASPSDVQQERKSIVEAAEEINRGIARANNLLLEVYRWEIDSYPGFHPEGPQGWIDQSLDIEDLDLLIGIFWKRFGTPTTDARSGTEHEFRIAYNLWKQTGSPQIMVYFNQSKNTLSSLEEVEQVRLVIEFKQSFPSEGLFWNYEDVEEFGKLIRGHFTRFILNIADANNKSDTAKTGSKKSTNSVPPLDEQIALWVQAKSKSNMTEKAYNYMLMSYRKALQREGLDLDSDNNSVLLAVAQDCANKIIKRSDKIAPRTYNTRLYTLISNTRLYTLISFFRYAVKQSWRETNPLENVEVRELLDVDKTEPLDNEEVKAALKKVQRNTISGKRDYALLCILLTMGLHVSEICSLRYGDITITGDKVTITYLQKGGSKDTQSLLPATACIFSEYFTSFPGLTFRLFSLLACRLDTLK
ncbi:MAG: tyrosine-type recombinase/integrase [Ktedonobacteraceae bacterium]